MGRTLPRLPAKWCGKVGVRTGVRSTQYTVLSTEYSAPGSAKIAPRHSPLAPPPGHPLQLLHIQIPEFHPAVVALQAEVSLGAQHAFVVLLLVLVVEQIRIDDLLAIQFDRDL